MSIVMGQYRPAGQVLNRREQYAEIGRATSSKEYAAAKAIAGQEGLYRMDGRWRTGQRFLLAEPDSTRARSETPPEAVTMRKSSKMSTHLPRGHLDRCTLS